MMSETAANGDDRVRVLYVGIDSDDTEALSTALERENDRITVETACTVDGAVARLADDTVDCLVSDYTLSDGNGIELLETVRDGHPDLPFIIYTAQGSEGVASEAISAGVTDYLKKEPGTEQHAGLANRITDAVNHYRSQQAVSERTQALQSYKRMVNAMQETACIYDAAGRFKTVNEALAEWYDATCAELEGQTSRLVPHIRAEGETDRYQELLDGTREKLSGEIEAEFPGHGHAVIAYQLTPLLVDGVIDGIVGVARDVTDRKERERELLRNKRAIDEAPVGVTITDPTQPDNPLIYANEHYRDLTGYSHSELLGKNCRVLQGENTDPEPVATMRGAIDAEERVTVELRNYRKDGTEFWNRVRIAPVRDDDGTVVNYVGFQQDITARKRREKRLEETSSRLEALFENSPDMIDVLDSNGTICEVNQRFCAELGYDESEVLGRSIWEFDRKFDAEDVQTQLSGFSVNERRKFEGLYERRDGSTMPVEVHLLRLSLDGEDRFLAISRDITERKEREQELEQQNEQLEQFASVVSHDLRNPLTVARGRLKLLREESDSEHLDAIDSAHQRMDTLIDDLLTLARDGSSPASPVAVDLEPFVQTCWQNVDTKAAALRTDIARPIRADESRLRQLFENLIRNAVEHGGDDVTVTVGELADGFYVADDGPGIPVADRRDVFDAGYSTAVDGTGFGLSIVKQVADAHGWTVRVVSGTDGGARFEFTDVDTVSG
ncbi:PAS domain S-box protein [Haloarcula sp. CBA1130]|uniref:PAS domain S-box protein n=1 Tax=unclassified Haloarcula TaxID=2624677 RepID=UPI001246A3A0|nr:MULTISPECIES: PAS domain S-box protein [unclassified Haloarcula]KAA9398670.1 PAS domain S-box protein [Haloarcula sp. CBA1129]KAA9403187.1 PAS domain S-box protein [Haloarcula sp. CBA1130]